MSAIISDLVKQHFFLKRARELEFLLEDRAGHHQPVCNSESSPNIIHVEPADQTNGKRKEPLPIDQRTEVAEILHQLENEVRDEGPQDNGGSSKTIAGITTREMEYSKARCEEMLRDSQDLRTKIEENSGIDDKLWSWGKFFKVINGPWHSTEEGVIDEGVIGLEIVMSEENKQACPMCGRREHVVWDGCRAYREITPSSSSKGVGSGVVLRFRPRMLRCTNPQCCVEKKERDRKKGKKKIYEYRYFWRFPEEFIGRGQRYTRAAKEKMGREASENTSDRCSSHTIDGIPVRTIHREKIKYRQRTVAAVQPYLLMKAIDMGEDLILAVDDKSSRRGRSYQTLVYNLVTGELLCVVEGRTAEELHQNLNREYGYFFKQMKPRAIVMDGARGYHNWAEKTFGEDIEIVMDRFHVVRWMRDNIRSISKLMSSVRSDEVKQILKENPYLLYKAERKLEEDKLARLERVLEESEPLRVIHSLRSNVDAWYENKELQTREEAKAALEALLSQTTRELAQLERNAKDIEDEKIKSRMRKAIAIIRVRIKAIGAIYKESIVNYHVHGGATNGLVEGRNRAIEVIQSKSYGIPNAKNRQAAIYMECNRRPICEFLGYPMPRHQPKRKVMC